MVQDDSQSNDDIPIEETDPAAKDVMAQQGIDSEQVELDDRNQLQRDLTDQGTTNDDLPPIDEATDDRDTSDGQLISS